MSRCVKIAVIGFLAGVGGGHIIDQFLSFIISSDDMSNIFISYCVIVLIGLIIFIAFLVWLKD